MSGVGREKDYDEILKFVTESGRQNKGIKTLVYKIVDVVTKYVNRSVSFYRDWDSTATESAVHEIQKRLNIKSYPSNYAIAKNSGKRFLSIDVKHANFTALKIMSADVADEHLDISLTWPEFLKHLIPRDERSAKPQLGIVAQTFQIPECIYESKHIRITSLSKCNKLQHVWVKTCLDLLSEFLALEDLDSKFDSSNVYVNSDEFIIELDPTAATAADEQWKQGDEIIRRLRPNTNIFRTTLFEIQSVESLERW